MSKILLYERPSSSKLFRAVIKSVHGASSITGISSYRGTSEVWSGDYLYNERYDGVDSDLAELMDDIICRDRSLSLMVRSRAERIVSRFWNGAKELLDKKSYSYFYTVSIDCYEIDILLRLTARRGIPAVSWIGTFLGGYARMTLRGERTPLGRSVPSEESVEVTKRLLERTFLPASETNNVKKKGRDAKKFYLRRKLIETIYNPIQKIRHNDPDNLMYNVYTFSGLHYSDIYSSGYETFFSSLDDLNIDRASTIYYPMHLIPEATTSYWCQRVITPGYGGNLTSYEEFVKKFVTEAEDGVHFLIKEHPAMFGRRPLSFYRELQALANVDVIHPMVRSNDVLERVDNVLVDDGTVGIEALLRGKRVVSLEDNYYSDLHPNISVVKRVTREAMSSSLSSYKPEAFISSLLADMFASNYVNNNKQNACEVAPIVEGVKLFLSSKREGE